MLRRARWILLVALLALAAGTARLFLEKRASLRSQRPKLGAALAANTTAAGIHFEHEIAAGGKTKALVRARQFRQVKEPNVFLLEDLEMEIIDPDEPTYHLVRSKSAVFDIPNASMFSESEAEITLSLPRSGEPEKPPVKIRATEMTFDSRTSRVSTEKLARFEVGGAHGEAVGAFYDPNAHELTMNSRVRLEWESRQGRPPMVVESSRLVWRETGDEVYLAPPARLRRGAFTLDAAKDSVVLLKDGRIDRLEARDATGGDHPPGRQISYQAGYLVAFFNQDSQVRRVEASEPARLVSASGASETTITGERIDLDFDEQAKDSTLRKAVAFGRAQAEARDRQQGAVRRLRSEMIEMIMRPGGEEIQEVATHAPGEVEFLPAKAGEKRRVVNGERMTFYYGGANALERAHVVQAATRTYSPPRKDSKGAKETVATTRSQALEAFFDTETGQMTKLEQWLDFQYEEEGRRAVAERAALDNLREIITLQEKARLWDATGSTAAREIVIEQATGNMIAFGEVNSTRLPEKKQSSSGMLADGQAMQARAERMSVTEDNQRIVYEGGAVLWQGARRIEGRTIVINRKEQTLEARGQVMTQLPEQTPGGGFTIVRSDAMFYSERLKQAFYSSAPNRAVTLERPALRVVAKTLKAWFVSVPKKEGGEETQVDRMLCEGAVRLAGSKDGRQRDGESEAAEYFPREERLELWGGNPVVTDSARGVSRGARITWLTAEDRLIVDNTGSGPAVSRIKDSKRK